MDFGAAEVAEEHAVYKVVLEEKCICETNKILVLQPLVPEYIGSSDTEVKQYGKWVKERCLGASSKAIDEMFRKLYEPHILNDQLKLNVKWALTDRQTLESFREPDHKPGTWRRNFNQKYPEAGIVATLSRVGFDRSRTEAFVDVTCDTRSDYYSLKKRNGKWTVQKVFNHGVS